MEPGRTKKRWNAGDGNPRWNGGTSEYPNHYLLKKQRKKILAERNGACEACGGEATLTHHRDGDKSNHDLSNLQPLCHPCHIKVHSGRKNKVSKYKSLCGMTLNEMSERSGLHVATIWNFLNGKSNPHRLTAAYYMARHPVRRKVLMERYANVLSAVAKGEK